MCPQPLCPARRRSVASPPRSAPAAQACTRRQPPRAGVSSSHVAEGGWDERGSTHRAKYSSRLDAMIKLCRGCVSNNKNATHMSSSTQRRVEVGFEHCALKPSVLSSARLQPLTCGPSFVLETLTHFSPTLTQVRVRERVLPDRRALGGLFVHAFDGAQRHAPALVAVELHHTAGA